MRAMPVVLVDPWSEMLLALGGVLIGAGIGPFSQGGLDEAFGVAIGAWGIGSGASVLESEMLAGIGEGIGAIGRSIVGEHGFEVDAEPCVVGQGGVQEVQHRRACFIRVKGREGDTGVVVDGDMDILRSDALDGVVPVAGHAVAGPRDAHQALDVEVKEVARPRMFIAMDGRGRFQIAYPAQLEPLEDATHRGRTQGGLLRDALAGPTYTACPARGKLDLKRRRRHYASTARHGARSGRV